MDTGDIVENIIERVIDFDTLSIRAPYKSLGKSLYKNLSSRIKNSKLVRVVRNNPEIQVKVKETANV